MSSKTRFTITGLIFLSLFIILTLFAWLYSEIEGSLAKLDGKTTIYGLTHSVTVLRDKQGVVTIRGQNREDVSVATGFVHAQERYFQMDLMRRNAAGELSSLFGEVAINYDKKIRNHRFRERARLILTSLPKSQFALIKAYTRGVNQGLNQLASPPFEYLLLGQEPVVWREEDTLLTIFSMYIDLQSVDGKREKALGLMQDHLPKETFAFLTAKSSQWDSAIDGSHYPAISIPSEFWPTAPLTSNHQWLEQDFPGSSSWAIDGSIAYKSSAIIANDMHLNLRVPNTWFRASFEFPVGSSSRKVTGATLPGTPSMVIGSNGFVAWGFTNSYGDWSDVIKLSLNDAKDGYLTPQGYKNFITHDEIIAIKGQESVTHTVKETIWGPVITSDNGDLYAYRWVAHDIEAVNLELMAMENANSVDDALIIATKTGIPAQNLTVADSRGNIAWTIMGPIPQRNSSFGQVPQSWADGSFFWQGYLDSSLYPKIKNPEHHRIWTANTRVVGGDMVEKIGDAGYALGARGKQISDNLKALSNANEAALLAIAMDDNAIFLTPWRDFIKTHISQSEVKIHFAVELERLLTEEPFKASVDSASYRFVRQFRQNIIDALFTSLNSYLQQFDQQFSLNDVSNKIEPATWLLITEQPRHFPLPNELSWSEFISHIIDKTTKQLTYNGSTLSEATWGLENLVQIQHPMSKSLSWLSPWLDMPTQSISGDKYMPKIQGRSFGASQRMVVAPGHEQQGIFHMPTGQSGHPWSPFYRAGHDDWVNGIASPFLPTEPIHTLTLYAY